MEFTAMTSKIGRYSFGGCLASLVFCFGVPDARAQSAPEMREILSRLDRLEQTNQALTEEIRLMRKELATLRPEAAGQTQVAATDGTTGGQSPGHSSASTDGEARAV